MKNKEDLILYFISSLCMAAGFYLIILGLIGLLKGLK